jgi:hypothetical protein
MRGNGRYRLALGLALGSSLAFLVFLLARPVDDSGVKLVANLAQLLAPVVAAASCAAAAVSGTGRTRRAWACWPRRPPPGRSGRPPGSGTSTWSSASCPSRPWPTSAT